MLLGDTSCHWSDPVQGLGRGHQGAAYTLHKGNGSFTVSRMS